MTHYTYDDILTHPDRKEHLVTLMLKAGDTAEHPASSKEHHYFKGPAKVEYVIYPDGVHAIEYQAPALAVEALADALAAWTRASDKYTDSEPGDDAATDALFDAGCAVAEAAARIPKLVESGRLLITN